MHLSNIKKEELKSFSHRAIALCYITLIFTFSIPKFTSFNYDPNMNLSKLAPHLATFVVSFVTIAAFWVAQGRILNLIKGVHAKIIWQYRAYFVCLVLVSIAAVTLSSDPFEKSALMVYTSFLLLTAIFYVCLLYSALNVKPVVQDHPISILKSSSLKRIALVGPACYLLAIAAIFFSIYISFLAILTAMFFYIFFMKTIKSEY